MQTSHQQATSLVENLLQQQTSSQVDKILEKYIPSQANTALVKTQILDAISGQGNKKKVLFLLKQYQQDLFKILPDYLKQDEDILISVLQGKPEMFQTLTPEQKQQPKFQDIFFGDMLKKGVHIGKILEFFELLSQKNSTRLKGVFQKALENKSYIFSHRLSELLYNIFISDGEIFKTLKTKSIFQNMYASFSLSKTFMHFISQKIQLLQQAGNTTDISQTEIFLLIQDFLGLGKTKLSENTQKFLELLAAGITIPKNKKQENAEKQEETNQERNKENIDNEQHGESGNQEYSKIGPFYSASYGASSSIWDDAGNTLNITTNILESMSEKSLENFMNFSLFMQEIGLGFLVKKHTRLLQVATDIDFYSGEGMTGSKTLKLLNSVGKNIGIPQSSYEDPKGNRKTSCFQTLSAAKMHFGEIRSSGKIGDFYQDPARRGDQEIVEIYMKYENIIGGTYNELQIADWK